MAFVRGLEGWKTPEEIYIPLGTIQEFSHEVFIPLGDAIGRRLCW